MKKNILATSIVEAMIVLLIVMMAVTWAYDMFSKSIKLTNSTWFKLQAISMAKEWIEAMINIRDTNWKVLPWDYTNCWNSFNYNINCHNQSWILYDIPNNTSFTISKDPTDYRWKLTQESTWLYSDPNYRSDFIVWYDSDGFYTQSWALIDNLNPLNPDFTREIKVNYIEDGITGWDQWSNEQQMKVTSLVQWKDQASDNIKKVELTTILSNWKNVK
jgi:hypothetical protein